MLRELSDSELGEEELELFWVATHWIIQDSEPPDKILQAIFNNMGNDSVVDNSRILCNTTQLDFIWLKEKKHDLLRKEGNSHAAPTPNGQHPDLCWLKNWAPCHFSVFLVKDCAVTWDWEKKGAAALSQSLSQYLSESSNLPRYCCVSAASLSETPGFIYAPIFSLSAWSYF